MLQLRPPSRARTCRATHSRTGSATIGHAHSRAGLPKPCGCCPGTWARGQGSGARGAGQAGGGGWTPREEDGTLALPSPEQDQEALIQRLEPEPSDSLAEGGAALSLHPRPLGTALGRGGASVREAPPREGCNPRATVGDCALARGRLASTESIRRPRRGGQTGNPEEVWDGVGRLQAAAYGFQELGRV